MTTSDPVRVDVWEGLLNAQFNMRYYEKIYHRFSRRDKGVRALFGIGSPATLASLAGWKAFPGVSNTLLVLTGVFGVLAAVGAVLNPVLGYSDMLAEFSARYATWSRIEGRFETLWKRIEDGDTVTLDQYLVVNKDVPVVSGKELDIPRDVSLMDECQQAVLKQINV